MNVYSNGVFTRKEMASNFQIFSYKTKDSLHLKLNGDFDGNSAYELINTLNEAGTGFWEIFIDTNGLKTIHPFGRDVFEKNLSNLNNKLSNLIFIGEKRHKISPS
jgi:anti-anti-sigma regulatory factor